jgi:ABC-type branched-subunit amino acid transport system ATPase component
LSVEPALRGAHLRTTEVTAGYAGRPVVHDVSVQARPGQVVSIVGPNGSGKSTILKSIVGVVRVLSGQVLVDDTDVTNRAPEDIARLGVGYVPQVDDVFTPLTVRENLEMGGYLLPHRQVAAGIGVRFGVADDHEAGGDIHRALRHRA